jgi:hypothetical protein
MPAPIRSLRSHAGIPLLLMALFRLVAAADGAAVVRIDSLAELAAAAAADDRTVVMTPGVYRLADFIGPQDLAARRAAKNFHFLEFSGSGNEFRLEGVTIELDSELRRDLRAPIHHPEFLLSGHRNTIRGLTIICIGDGTSPGGSLWSIDGDDNTMEDCTFHVRGSFPYGYGDLFGKGGGPVIGHRKHSGVRIAGNRSRIIGCTLQMRSFGHGFYVQGGNDHYFENCLVEGEMRATDDMLAETSGPAFEAGFRSEVRNREGVHRVLPGYMKSLAEDGFRTYDGIGGVTLVNCTAKHMRGGFELRTRSGGVRIENCTAIGNERGFWVGNGSVILNSRGDARYGPLLFVDGDDVSVELALMPERSASKVHALAIIHGTGARVAIRSWEGRERPEPLPILVGFSQPGAGEGMAPFGERAAVGLELRNETTMPVLIGPRASGGMITTRGEIQANEGDGVGVTRLED